MGNVLTCSNTHEIQPLESYIRELTFDNSVENLGSTRFMKVARAADSSGCQVWKVFVTADSTLDFAPYKREFEREFLQLSSLLNCCPFRTLHSSEELIPRHAIFCRPFHKHTLTDRLTTRPLIVSIEKHWFIYQILRGLAQCHGVNVCHGDLKSQNILISSSGWLQIADFAFFKPTYLEENDPSVFTYFFDTSRRQMCYIAPERILSQPSPLSSTKIVSEGLVPSMDIFSAGCVILELLNDGVPPFTYAQLCRYRKMPDREAEVFVSELVSRTGVFSHVLRKMLSKDAMKRPTAADIVADSSLFPELISYLFSYLNAFRPKELAISSDDLTSDTKEADDVIAKLLNDESVIVSRLSQPETPSDAAVFFITLVTSSLRAIRSSSVRVSAMRLLVRFSQFSSSSIALQRILPYLVSQLSEYDRRDSSTDPPPSSIVSSYAIEAIAHLISPLSPDSLEDSLVFIDYLFPKFESIVNDRSIPSSVLLALAKHLGTFGECALRFSKERKEKHMRKREEETGEDKEETVQLEEEESDASLQQHLASFFSNLLTKEDEVKLVVVRTASLRKLYPVFESHGKPEYLLAHLVTILNGSSDWRLRAAFFKALPVIVRRRIQAAGIDPLLLQGIHDTNEVVSCSALSCTRRLALSKLLDESFLAVDFIKQFVPFLIHPNEALRNESCEMVVSLDSLLSLADCHVKLLPKVLPYLKTKLFRLNCKLVVLDSLIPPIPRSLWKDLTSLPLDRTKEVRANLRGQMKSNILRNILKMYVDDGDITNRLKLVDQLLVTLAEYRTIDSKSRAVHGSIDMQRVQKREHSLVASKNGDSFALSQPTRSRTFFLSFLISMQLSVYDVCVSELLEGKRREAEGRRARTKGTFTNARGTIEGLRGKLVMHLHEHSDSVTQLSLNGDSSRLASSSKDGSFKIWSTSQLAGDSYGAVRAEATYSFNQEGTPSHSLNGIGWTSNDVTLVVANSHGQVIWADASTEVKEVSRVCFPEEDGSIQQIILSGNLVYARTHHGAFYCLDSRLLVEVNTWKHPSPYGLPSAVWASPHMSSDIPRVLMAGSVCGEMSLFNLSVGTRSDVFWPSYTRKPLDYSRDDNTTDLNKSMRALCVEEGGWVLMGDTRGELRKWNYIDPAKSAFLSGIGLAQVRRGQVKYKKSLADDRGSVGVTYEFVDHQTRPQRPVLEVSSCHRTSISSVATLPSGFAVTSGTDGCMKVWM